MAEKYRKRVEELKDVYGNVINLQENFGDFIRSQLARDALKKNNISALDLRYVTLQPDMQLYSFAELWQYGMSMHVYSTRFEDHVPLPKSSEEETSCARFFVTERPLRVLSVHRNLVIELCKKWMKGHDDSGIGNETENANSIDEASELPAVFPRNLFQRKAGLTLLDYVFHQERSVSFYSIDGVAFDEPVPAPPTVPFSRHLLLFGTEGLNLKQELIYPSKKKLRKSPDGFVSCVSEPSRPQAPPMKRGKSVNNPPVGSLPSPAGTPPPPPPSTHHSTRTPPPHPPHPTPRERPGTPTLPDEKGEGLSKAPPKPTVQPRESTLSRDATPPKAPPPAAPPAPPSPKVPNGSDSGHEEDDVDTPM